MLQTYRPYIKTCTGVMTTPLKKNPSSKAEGDRRMIGGGSEEDKCECGQALHAQTPHIDIEGTSGGVLA